MGRLSDDLRLGAMLKKQARGDYETSRGRTCAVAAICDARGTLDQYDDAGIKAVENELDQLTPQAFCPVCKMGQTVSGVVINLNDFHRWTREKIADWLEPVEQPKKAQAAQAVTA